MNFHHISSRGDALLCGFELIAAKTRKCISVRSRTNVSETYLRPLPAFLCDQLLFLVLGMN
ncbi:hypothetical protein ACFL2H_06660 [Planctomycetota bacterium]